MNLKRRGRFVFTKEFIQGGFAGKVLAFMEFTPVSANFVNFGENIEYEGYSKFFNEIEPHQVTKNYSVTPTVNSDDELLEIACHENLNA